MKYKVVSSHDNGHECCFESAIEGHGTIIAEFVEEDIAELVCRLLNENRERNIQRMNGDE